MVTEEKVNQVHTAIYTAYGSSTGFLFGIEPKHKEVVRTIIKLVLENEENGS